MKKKKALKIILIILLIIVLLAVLIVGSGYMFLKKKLNKINYVSINEDNLEILPEVKDSLSKYRNIVFFGIDYWDQDAEQIDETGKGRSDCIMIASMNQETGDIKLTSLYRDELVDLNSYEYQNDGFGTLGNLNWAYRIGGAENAIATINRNYDLNIKEFVSVNFQSVATLVDSLGGVEIDITQGDLKYINSYIKNLNTLGMKGDYVNNLGKQKLNGTQAVAYSRIRYDGAEKKRTQRMRTVLTKCFEKMKSMSVTDLNKIADTMLPLVYTNVSSDEIFGMIPDISKYSITQTETYPTKVITSNKNATGVYHDIPCSLETNVIDLHKELFPDVEYTVSDTVKEISNRIKEATGYDENSF